MRRFTPGIGAPPSVNAAPEQTVASDQEGERLERPNPDPVSDILQTELARKVNRTIGLIDIDRVEDRMRTLMNGTEGMSAGQLESKIHILEGYLKSSKDYVERERKRLSALQELDRIDSQRLMHVQAENINVEAHRKAIAQLKKMLESLQQKEK